MTTIETDDIYCLMDTDTWNATGFYETITEALDDVRWCVEQYGRDSREVITLALFRETSPILGIAFGEELVKLALGEIG